MKRRGLLAAWRAHLHALLASHLAPGELFLAVAVGAMIGCTPLYGLHLLLCIACGALLHLNTTAMYAAANISVPPMIPLLGLACVQTGERLLRGRWLALGVADFRALASGPHGVPGLMARFFTDWLVGGLPVGAAIGVTLGAVVFGVARLRRGSAPLPPPPSAADRQAEGAIAAAIAEASQRYRRAPRNLAVYARFKYRLDPVYHRLARLVPERSLTVDVGTGLGMLPLVLALLPGERRALGIDWDRTKLAAGRAAAAGLGGVELLEGDARALSLPPCDVVSFVDVLHYHAAAEQTALLAAAVAALRPGGKVLVRDGDAARRGGARWTRLVERLAVAVGWNRGAGPTRFRHADELRAELSSLGLEVEVEPLAGALHPGNVLLIGTKSG